jgi:hypothetical protein
MGMSKDEFTRKLFGDKQHQKNEWLKKQRNVSNDADVVSIISALKIRKKNYGY